MVAPRLPVPTATGSFPIGTGGKLATSAVAPPKRFLFVDALRGVACVAVLIHHMVHSNTLSLPLQALLPRWVVYLTQFGALGVQIFFALSGFVIAHSVRELPLNAKGIGNFALRRQIRLDPPYWCVLIVTLLYLAAEKLVPHAVTAPYPNLLQILANFFYLPAILQSPFVVGVSWTLTLEVQFYLFFILTLAALQRVSKSHAGTAPVVLIATGALSVWFRNLAPGPHFTNYWFFFCAGVLAYWAFRGQLSRPAFIAALLTIGGLGSLSPGVTNNSGTAIWAGLTVALVLFLVAQRGKLEAWSGGPLLQFLGRMSYSLYLAHLLIVQVVGSIGFKLTGMNGFAAIGWSGVSVALSVIAAWMLFRFVERPSMVWASRLKTVNLPTLNAAV